MKTPTCSACGTHDDLRVYSTWQSKTTGKITKYYRCYPCTRERARAFYATERGKAARRRWNEVYTRRKLDDNEATIDKQREWNQRARESVILLSRKYS